MHQIFIDVDVEGSGDEGVREGEADPAVQACAFAFEGLPDVSGGAHVELVLAALESRGDGVNGVQEEVGQP